MSHLFWSFNHCRRGRRRSVIASVRRNAGLAIAIGVVVFLRASDFALCADAPKPILDRLIFSQIPARPPGDGHSGEPLPDGSRIVIYNTSHPEAGVANLTSGFAAAGRPDLSFDGRRMLFVGKRQSSDRFSVWEMAVDAATDITRVVDSPWDCRSVRYLSTIYTINMEHPERHIAFGAMDLDTGHSAIFTLRRKDGSLRRITFTRDGAFDPCILCDGRLLFAGWKTERTGTSLFTVNTDGTDVSAFAATHEPTAYRGMACDTPGGDIVYVESHASGSGWDNGGSLVAVSRKRSLHTRRLITPESDGTYHSPSAMSDGRLLVSYRASATDGQKGDRTYGIYMLDPADGRRVAAVFDAPQWHDMTPLAVGPRPEPAGRSSVVNVPNGVGRLYGLDAYLFGTERADDTGDRRIATLRVIGAVDGKKAEEKVLGEVPVEADGSFFLEIPSRTPLRLQTLDPSGHVLTDMRSWIWVMPKESRGCIGCHEDRELTPPNRLVRALRAAPHRVGLSDQPVGAPEPEYHRRGGYPK